MQYRLISLAALAALSACTTVQHRPLTAESSASLNGKTVVQTQYQKPDFTAFTAAKAAFGLLGAAAMVSEGNDIVRDNDIADPALAISAGLGERLNKARGVTVVPAKGNAANDEIATLITQANGAQYLLDVKTLGWMFNYYPTAWGSYKVTYNGRLRLIDAKSKEVAAESMCQTVQGDDANPPSKDQLLANKAELLKSYLAKAASSCVDVLSRDVLKL